ncbi:MAG: 16S rRNA (cytosine(967)-C(5))-methyltransferase RsmB [Desulfobulbaceae bacterium]|nr:16S rRNA (cytosine(967)-C(5))-methyltransferase RsmB [Desulfobulbaceae bacterium]
MEKVTGSMEKIEERTIQDTARYHAVKLLNRYDRSDSYIDKLLSHELRNESLSSQDKALMTEIINGVIRWRGKLDWVLTGFYHGDYQKCLNLVKNAMRIAVYQIMFLNRIPIPAAINESVEIVKTIQGEKTAAIVNGVLRNIARNLDNIRYPERGDDEIYFISVMFSHPKWMTKRWIDRYGLREGERLLEANNQRPYVAVRVNNLLSNPDEIKSIFEQHNVAFRLCEHNESSLLLDSPKYDLTASDLFRSGRITIQDPAAAIVAQLADPKPGDFVIDLCAAPGGKSFILAELMENEGKIIALDKHESKLRFINEGAERLSINIIKCDTADAIEYTSEEQADMVLADVPCSGLGTISKKPDIKWKREPEEIAKMVILQRNILENAGKLVKPGGVLVYSTCTIEPEENEDNILWFLESHPEFTLDYAENHIDANLCKNGFYVSLPHLTGMDGAFGARLVKKQ